MRAVHVNHLPPESTALRETQASPEWPNWQRARKIKMDEQLARQVTRSTIEGGGGGCNKFVPVLRGDATIIGPTGDIFDQASGGIS